MNGNHLILSQAGPGDSGVYTCQISAYTPTQLSHTVVVRGEYSTVQYSTVQYSTVQYSLLRPWSVRGNEDIVVY